jgi:hypothetical protein
MGAAVLRKDAGGDDPRGALRAAIAMAKQAQAAVDEKQSAIERARRFVREVEERIEEATKALNGASEEHAAAVADAIARDEKPPAAVAVKAARVVLNDHQDELASAQAALDRVGDAKDDLKHAAALAEGNILLAIAELVVPVCQELFARVRRTRTELAALVQTLSALTELDQGLDWRDARAKSLVELRDQVLKLNLEPARGDWTGAQAMVEPWLRWRDALAHDADVPAPDGGS